MRTVRKNSHQAGQALLVVLLALAVMLTVVLSVASRSITDIAVTTYEEEALRAFSAAEAGIEETLLTGIAITVPTDVGDGSQVQTNIAEDSVGNTFDYPTPIGAGETATFWFVGHNDDGNLTCDGVDCARMTNLEVCYGSSGVTPEPAIEVSIYYDPSSTKKATSLPNNFGDVDVFRYTADPISGRASSNEFFHSSGSCSFGNYEYSRDLNLAGELGSCATAASGGCLLMAKVKMFYNTTPQRIGIKKTGVVGGLPPQGINISSTGTAGQSTRQVNVFRSYPEPHPVFDASMFSWGDLSK